MADNAQLKNIVEASLLAAGKPLDLDQLLALFEENQQPDKKALRAVLAELTSDYAGRGIEVAEVASGWRIQVRADYANWVSRLWEEKPARYSRALMETLALIAYRQPITRGEIEEIRGVSVSSNITKTLLEREWIRVVGQRDVPGKPSLYGTTRTFLDYFNLKGLDDLPTLAEIRDLDEINRALDLEDPDRPEGGQQSVPHDSAEQLASAAVAAGLGEEAGDESILNSEPDVALVSEADPQTEPVGDESEFEDLLPEFESDWDETLPADTQMSDTQDSGWADELAEELEDELAKSELKSDATDDKPDE
jgi:segregation and condensation protein B